MEAGESGMSHIENAKDYVSVAKDGIYIEYISHAEINDMKSSLDAKWLDACTVPGTQQLN